MAGVNVLQFSVIKLLHLGKRNRPSLPLALFLCLYLLAVKDKNNTVSYFE